MISKQRSVSIRFRLSDDFVRGVDSIFHVAAHLEALCGIVDWNVIEKRYMKEDCFPDALGLQADVEGQFG